MDILNYNKTAWNNEVRKQCEWTRPVGPETIAKARKGEFDILLTPTKPVPLSWFPPLKGLEVLCLASGGGQQGPILAAAGAQVTVFDNSPKQLEQDQLVAKREHLQLNTIEGDMTDLSAFKTESIDFIFHPVSNCFIDNVIPVWKETYRVLKKGGTLVSGFNNPILFLFENNIENEQDLIVKYSIPYSDLTSLSCEKLKEFTDKGEPLEFGHSLDDQIGEQIRTGFHIIGFYEDTFGGKSPIDNFIPGFIATRALKPA